MPVVGVVGVVAVVPVVPVVAVVACHVFDCDRRNSHSAAIVCLIGTIFFC